MIYTRVRLRSPAVLEAVREAVQTRTPFSAIRLGDGEGRVMGYPEHTPVLQLAEIWQIWFGHAFWTDSHVKFVADHLRAACRNADVIGLPLSEPHLDSDFGRPEAIIQGGGWSGPQTRFADSGFHLDVHEVLGEDLYGRFFADMASVGVIGCRNIGDALRDKYGVAETMWLPVPPEMRFSDLPDDRKLQEIILRPHLFQRFGEIWNWGIPHLMSRGPGTLVLVGAGVLGKLYCDRIKALGGVALDVGSMMDLWAGLKTRGIVFFDELRDVPS